MVATEKTRLYDNELINFLFSKSNMNITEDVFMAALSNRMCRKIVIKVLLSNKDVKKTKNVLIVIVGNLICGKKMIEVILNNKNVKITKKISQTALYNKVSKNAIELLFNKNSVQIIVARVEEAICHLSISFKTLELCLYNFPTEYLLKVVLAMEKILKLLPIVIYKRHTILACLLIENGANFIAIDDYKRKALQIAAKNDYETIVQFF